MATYETAKFDVEMILTTHDGELPTDSEIEHLIWKELDGKDNVRCIFIKIKSRTGEL